MVSTVVAVSTIILPFRGCSPRRGQLPTVVMYRGWRKEQVDDEDLGQDFTRASF